MTQETKERVYQFLEGKSFNIEDLERTLNVDNRYARYIVAEYAKEKPVISLSQEKGYHFINAPKDISANELKDYKEMVEHQIKDLQSRIAKLSERIVPLEQWLEAYENNDIING